jgi:hypothetical protein
MVVPDGTVLGTGNLPWDSWEHSYIRNQPPVWFHEVLRPDGTPYREAEVNLIR